MIVFYQVLLAVLGLAAFGGLILGRVSTLQLFVEGRRAGLSGSYLYLFGVYRFAFKEKKGSPETRRMVIGYASCVGAFILVAVVGALLEPLLAAAR